MIEMVCRNCGKENKNTNIRCEFCNTELSSIDDNSSQKKEEVTLEQKLCLLCFWVISGVMIIYGLFLIGNSVYSWILENKIKNEYNMATATLVDYTNCEYDEDNNEVCNAIYEYVINNNTYMVSLDLEAIRDVYENSEIVYYNPNNPSESVIYAGTERFLSRIVSVVLGIVMICVAIFVVLFTLANYKIIKEAKKVM